MKRKEHIVSYTLEEIKAMLARGEDKTDWERVKAMTEEELEAAIASDPDEAGMAVDWSKAVLRMPESKETMTIRLDRDVLQWFRAQGRGYQSRINAILRSYMEQKSGGK